MALTAKQIAVTEARNASSCAAARLWGWKYRARNEPPTAATGGFPYLHRSCADWVELPNGEIIEREQSFTELRSAARRGSKKLLEALLSMAA